MSVAREISHYWRLAAPRADRTVLVVPRWRYLPRLLEENRAVLARVSAVDVQGRGLGELSAQARRQLIADAVAYTKAYRDVVLPGDVIERPLLLAGHQPQMFHPGVWCKNFALDRLARQEHGVAVNLLIDSDAAKRASCRVPGGTVEAPFLREVSYDKPPMPGIACEDQSITDMTLVASFGERAAEILGSLVADPLLRAFWPRVIERGRATGNMSLALAQARHQLEGSWGLNTLELPQSHCCRSEPFLHFAAHLLAQLPRFWDIYNGSLADFRRANRIRSAAHPVPDLADDDEWLEAPFWVWTGESPRRRRLFVRCRHDALVLSDRAGLDWPLELTPDGDARRAVEQLAEAEARGIHVRTRALVTTMYARLVLGDLFIHGIGGSRYDELTDEIIARFFAIQPPAYATLSGTLRLPLPLPDVEPEDLGRVEHELRELDYHAERYLEGAATDSQVSHWMRQKQEWIAAPAGGEKGRERHGAIRRLNRSLRESLDGVAERLQQQRDGLRQALRHRAILASREYDFCLHPERTLRPFLLEELPAQLVTG